MKKILFIMVAVAAMVMMTACGSKSKKCYKIAFNETGSSSVVAQFAWMDEDEAAAKKAELEGRGCENIIVSEETAYTTEEACTENNSTEKCWKIWMEYKDNRDSKMEWYVWTSMTGLDKEINSWTSLGYVIVNITEEGQFQTAAACAQNNLPDE